MNFILAGLLTLALGLGAAASLAAQRVPGGATDTPAAAEKAAVVQGNNRFGLELYSRLQQGEGNLFLSPYSISAALAMTSAGARGRTLEQMASTLHLPGQEDLHPAMAALIREVNGAGKEKRGYQLSTANALWGQKGYPFKQDFLELTGKHYGAGLRQVDFAGATEQARRTINAWVEEETRDKIKELLKPGVLTGDTRLVLTNAIYFKGDWASQFKKDRTRELPFTLADGTTVRAPLMNQTGRFKYLDGSTFQALEMPYAGKDLAMVVLLPRKEDGLAELEKDITAERLRGWLGKMGTEQVQVLLPRCKVTTEFSLAGELSKMGMPLAFSRSADFSGMAESKEPLYLSAVVHKAFVDVNEEGTEAAAATAVTVRPTAAVVERPTPVFRADHPFLFLIRDTRSGSILFLGRLMNPK